MSDLDASQNFLYSENPGSVNSPSLFSLLNKKSDGNSSLFIIMLLAAYEQGKLKPCLVTEKLSDFGEMIFNQVIIFYFLCLYFFYFYYFKFNSVRARTRTN